MEYPQFFSAYVEDYRTMLQGKPLSRPSNPFSTVLTSVHVRYLPRNTYGVAEGKHNNNLELSAVHTARLYNAEFFEGHIFSRENICGPRGWGNTLLIFF
jgi:hypothetical protein